MRNASSSNLDMSRPINSNILDMGGVPAVELKERREATDCANSEFNRVKRAKLENERAKSAAGSHGGHIDEKAEKQLDRERANRASAAASRAKIVCYARELEKRTDRLERERNMYAVSSEKAIKKLGALREETKKLKDVLRNLWELKDPKTCSYLVDSNALFLLADKDNDNNDEKANAIIDVGAQGSADGLGDAPYTATPKKRRSPMTIHSSEDAAKRQHIPHRTQIQNQLPPQPRPADYYQAALPPTVANPAIAQRSLPSPLPHHPPLRLAPLPHIAPATAALLGPLPGVPAVSAVPPARSTSTITVSTSVPKGVPQAVSAAMYSAAPYSAPVAPYAYAATYNPNTNINRQPYAPGPPPPRERPLPRSVFANPHISPIQVRTPEEEERRRLQLQQAERR